MEPFVGQITLFPFFFAPRGWALCEGQLLPISQNAALFSLLGIILRRKRRLELRAAGLARPGSDRPGPGAGG